MPERSVFDIQGLAISWSAVIAGVIASLVVQVLLAMLGLGIGLLTVDVPAPAGAPATISWTAFAWWALTGIIASLVLGRISGELSNMDIRRSRALHALIAWSLAVLIVIGSGGLMATQAGNVLASLAGPTVAAGNRVDTVAWSTIGAGVATTETGAAGVTTGEGMGAVTPGGAMPVPPATPEQLDEARRALATATLASLAALLIGALAAYLASQTAHRAEPAGIPSVPRGA